MIKECVYDGLAGARLRSISSLAEYMLLTYRRARGLPAWPGECATQRKHKSGISSVRLVLIRRGTFVISTVFFTPGIHFPIHFATPINGWVESEFPKT